MVTTASASLTASAAEAARVQPFASAFASAASERSKARTSCPALARFAAMPLPILPRPIKATRAMSFSLPLGLTLVDEGAHPFFLVLGSEQAVEQAAFEDDPLGEAGFEGGVDHLLGRDGREGGHGGDR